MSESVEQVPQDTSSTKKQKVTASTDTKTPTAAELAKRGFFLETTAKEPDDKIYDYYHNPYSPENPFGDKEDYGKWILIPAADETKCVNPAPYPQWPKKAGVR